MNVYKVKLSDGETEWWQNFKAKNDDIIDAEGWDVMGYHLDPSTPAIVKLED
jgi:hypothetical protein